MRILSLSLVLFGIVGCSPPAPTSDTVTLVPADIESAPSECPKCSVDANHVAANLEALGFNCDLAPVNEHRGFRCRGKVTGYSLPINFFIPAFFQTAKPYALALHFHGWWLDSSTDPFADDRGDFGATLTFAAKNAILIVPESRGQNDTYASDLATPLQMTTLLQNIDKTLLVAGVPVPAQRPIILSGHSGAYVLIGRLGDWASSGEVPALRQVRGLILLDSAYGYRAGLVKLMDVMCLSGASTYFIAFNPSESSAKTAVNQQIYQEIISSHACANVKVALTADLTTAHMNFPRKYLSSFFSAALSDF